MTRSLVAMVAVAMAACGWLASPASAIDWIPDGSDADALEREAAVVQQRTKAERETLEEGLHVRDEWRERHSGLEPVPNDTLDLFASYYQETQRRFSDLRRDILAFRRLLRERTGATTFVLAELTDEERTARLKAIESFEVFRNNQKIVRDLGWRLYEESLVELQPPDISIPEEDCLHVAEHDAAAGFLGTLEDVMAYHREVMQPRKEFWLEEFRGFLELNLRECPENSSFMGQCVTSWVRVYDGERGRALLEGGGERPLKSVKWLFEERFLLGRTVVSPTHLTADEQEWMKQRRRGGAGWDGFRGWKGRRLAPGGRTHRHGF